MDDEALVVDFDVKNLSISTLNDILKDLAGNQKVVLEHLSREDVQFLRAAIDCYANVGLQIEKLTNKVEQMAQKMAQTDDDILKKYKWQDLYKQLQVQQPAIVSTGIPYPYQTYTGGTNP